MTKTKAKPTVVESQEELQATEMLRQIGEALEPQPIRHRAAAFEHTNRMHRRRKKREPAAPREYIIREHTDYQEQYESLYYKLKAVCLCLERSPLLCGIFKKNAAKLYEELGIALKQQDMYRCMMESPEYGDTFDDDDSDDGDE